MRGTGATTGRMAHEQGHEERSVGIVLSGAGARGAYEAGVLSVLLPLLKGADAPRIVVGTSAGALNAAMLASAIDRDVDPVVALIAEGWEQITPERIFATPLLSLLRMAKRRFRRPVGVSPGLLDTDVLRTTLGQMLPDPRYASWRGARRIGRGRHRGQLVLLGQPNCLFRVRSGPELDIGPPVREDRTRARPPDGFIGLPRSFPGALGQWPRAGLVHRWRGPSQHTDQAGDRPRCWPDSRDRCHALGRLAAARAGEPAEHDGLHRPTSPRHGGRLRAGGPARPRSCQSPAAGPTPRLGPIGGIDATSGRILRCEAAERFAQRSRRPDLAVGRAPFHAIARRLPRPRASDLPAPAARRTPQLSLLQPGLHL